MPPQSPTSLKKTIYTGTFIHTPSLGQLCVREHSAVGVDEGGVIRFIASLDGGSNDHEGLEKQLSALARGWGWGEDGWELVRGGERGRSWWFPGFVDTHTHASQNPNTGLFGSTTLLSWLQHYTFPLEASLSSAPKARTVYTHAVNSSLRHGTTTAAYYATAHAASTCLLARICFEKGQRAFIGRVCMDTDLSPEYYRDRDAEFAMRETKEVIEYCAQLDPERVLITPILTPRFAPSCSTELLTALGRLAREADLPIQTHISENRSECELVSHLFPNNTSYADVYDTHGLLTPRTVLAHAIHLAPTERALVRERGCGVSHCPVSNTALSSGICPVRTLLDEGVEVGLGTDVSGGYSGSVLVAAREAGMVSRLLASFVDEGGDKSASREGGARDEEGEKEKTAKARDRKKLSVEECLYLATRGGAKCLNLGHKVGAFEVGMEWDAQLIQLGVVAEAETESEARHRDFASGNEHAVGNLDSLNETDKNDIPAPLWGTETWEEKIAKWVFCGDDRNTKAVYVAGKLVHQRS